jgi:hypothetical protein
MRSSIRENLDGLAHRLEVVGGDQHRCGSPVAGDLEALMRRLGIGDELGQASASLSDREHRHRT